MLIFLFLLFGFPGFSQWDVLLLYGDIMGQDLVEMDISMIISQIKYQTNTTMREQSELEKYKKRQSSMHGILVKISDMTVQNKFQIVLILRESFDKVDKDDFYTINVSERVTNFLEVKYPGAWVCVIGKKFSGNVTHEPQSFLRASTQDYHILIYMLKFKEICLPKGHKERQRKNTSTLKIENIEKAKKELQTVENTPKSNAGGEDQKN